MMYIICNLKYDQISHGLRQLKLAELCFKQPSLIGAFILREWIVMGLIHTQARHTVLKRVFHHRGCGHVMQ